MLLTVMEESNIEIFVAELPRSIKDPAEFLEKQRDTEDALDEKFRAEVIDSAQEWTRWYMNSIIVAHDSVPPNCTGQDDGGFSQVFDSLATFLSIFESVDDRMAKAAIIAPKLADLVVVEKDNDDRDLNRTEISSTTRIQLASDLVGKASNIAHMKSQRNFRLGSSSETIVPKSLEIGNDMSLEEGSRSQSNQKQSTQTPHLETSSSENQSLEWQQEPPVTNQRVRAKQGNNFKQFQRSMTNHVGGISNSPFGDEWLGTTIDKVCFVCL